MTITDEKIEYQYRRLSALLKAKNQDYGDAFADAPYLAPEMNVIRAAQVRLSDKFRRLRTLWTTTRTPKSEESLEDTLRDIAGYCVLLLAYKEPASETTTNDDREAV